MGFVQRGIAGQPLRQVRVGNVRHTERDCVGLAFCQPGIGAVFGELLVGDINAAEILLQLWAEAVFSIMLTGTDEGDTALAELFGHVAEGFSTVCIAHVVHVEARREVNTYTASAPDIDDCVGHFEQQTRTIFHRTAVLVGALVAAGQQELFKQIAVGAMHFHAVEARSLGVFRTDAIGLDDVTDFRQLQRARYWQWCDGAHQAHVPFSRNGTRRDRGFAVQVGRVGNTAHVPQLQGDTATGVVHGLGDVAPATYLVVGPDAGGVRVTHAHRRHRGGFGQDQAGRGALHVILGHHRVRYTAFIGTAARQWGHDDAVGQLQIAQGDRVKDSRHVSNPRN